MSSARRRPAQRGRRWWHIQMKTRPQTVRPGCNYAILQGQALALPFFYCVVYLSSENQFSRRLNFLYLIFVVAFLLKYFFCFLFLNVLTAVQRADLRQPSARCFISWKRVQLQVAGSSSSLPTVSLSPVWKNESMNKTSESSSQQEIVAVHHLSASHTATSPVNI